MMRKTIILGVAAAGMAVAEPPSGHATAELLAASDGYSTGKPVETAVRLKMERGWHTYWTNPGEGGMPISVEWTLPDGWVAGPILHPVPVRFMTGDLAGFGYEGDVVLPVFLTAASEPSGPVEIVAKVGWLACSDSACVPGEAVVTLKLEEKDAGPGPDAKLLDKALERIPEPLEGADLEVEVREKSLMLKVRLPEGLDADGCDVFPATPDVVDPAAEMGLSRTDDGWQVEVARHEYATKAPDTLELVLAGGKLAKPLLLTWSAGKR